MDENVDPPTTRTDPAPLSRATPAKPRTRIGRIILLLIIVLGIGGGWYWWTHRLPAPAANTQAGARPGGGRFAGAAAQPVGAATVDKGDIRVILNELGTVTSLDTVSVVTQISGQLMQYGFTEGQMVKKGDFLAQIDPRPYQAALDSAQGTLARDQGLLDQAKADLKRYMTLGRQDSIAQQQLEDQKFLVQQDSGIVQTDQAAVETAKLNLYYCHIISPVDGQVGLRQVDPGNYVSTTGATPLVVVTQMQPISVIFSIPEDNLQQILARLHAGATLTVEAYDRSNNTLLASGALSNLDNQINTTTGTLNIRSMFQNPDDKLYPNQFVNIHLLVDTMQDTIRVPVPAVQRGEPGTFVYVINANNTVSVRPIKVGPTDGNYQAVLSGLQAGEKVVTDGTDRLRDGAAVTVPPPQGQPGQGQAGDGQARRHRAASSAAANDPGATEENATPGQAPTRAPTGPAASQSGRSPSSQAQ
jgi:multidrug efflux system membrane fusion protein